jgi:hypothetical protein
VRGLRPHHGRLRCHESDRQHTAAADDAYGDHAVVSAALPPGLRPGAGETRSDGYRLLLYA